MKVMEYEVVRPIIMKNGEEGFLLQEKYNSIYKIEWSRKEIRNALRAGTIKVNGLKLSSCGYKLLVDKSCARFEPKPIIKENQANIKLFNLKNVLEKNIIDCVQKMNDTSLSDTLDRKLLETKENVYNEILDYVNLLLKVKD